MYSYPKEFLESQILEAEPILLLQWKKLHVRSKIRFWGLKQQDGSRDEVLQKEVRKVGSKE